MHAIIAVGEAEVDVASTEFHLFSLVQVQSFDILIGREDGGIVDGLATGTFQHTALDPHLISPREYRHVIEHHSVWTCVGKEQVATFWIQQCLQFSLGVIELVNHHMLVLTVVDEINKGIVLRIRNLQCLGHCGKQEVCMSFFVTAEFHQAQEQQSSRIAGNLAFQLFADTIDSHLWVHASFTRHLVDVSQITVKAEVGLNIPDSEMMP